MTAEENQTGTFFVGDPPIECACDRCKKAGPAAYNGRRAEELAEQAGWEIGEEFVCPRCLGKEPIDVSNDDADHAPLDW